MDFFGMKIAETMKTASTTESTCQESSPPTKPEEGQTGGEEMKTNSDKFRSFGHMTYYMKCIPNHICNNVNYCVFFDI